MQEYKIYLNVILEMIEKIRNSVHSKEELIKNSEKQDANLMRLQVIGENIKSIPSEIKKKNKQINWKKFEKLRNLISHKYSSVDYNIVWDFIEKNLLKLKIEIENLK